MLLRSERALVAITLLQPLPKGLHGRRESGSSVRSRERNHFA
jgi:hypothetical protein